MRKVGKNTATSMATATALAAGEHVHAFGPWGARCNWEPICSDCTPFPTGEPAATSEVVRLQVALAGEENEAANAYAQRDTLQRQLDAVMSRLRDYAAEGSIAPSVLDEFDHAVARAARPDEGDAREMARPRLRPPRQGRRLCDIAIRAEVAGIMPRGTHTLAQLRSALSLGDS